MIIYLSSCFFYGKYSIDNESMREHGRTFSSVVIREDIFLKAIECRRATPARDLRSISERGVRVVKTQDARRASHRFGRLRFRRARRERLKEELACVCVCLSVLRANSSLAFSRSWNGIECNSSKCATRTARQESQFRKLKTIVQLLVHAPSHNRAGRAFMRAANHANTSRSKCLKSA